MIQDKFIEKYINDIYQIGEETNNIFILRGIQNESRFFHTNKKVEYIQDDNLEEFLTNLLEKDILIIHWYDSLVAKFVYKLKNKIIVYLWGGEFYEVPYWYHFNKLFDFSTKKSILLNGNLGLNKIGNNFLPFFIELIILKNKLLSLRQFNTRKKEIKRINYLVTHELNSFEVDNIKRIYNHKKLIHLSGGYDINFKITSSIKAEFQSGDTPSILVGNSATWSNNHLDFFEKIKYSQFYIYCPLSYGVEQVKEIVINRGKELFKSRFIPITDFLSREDYCNLLNKMDVVVMPHNRQQAWGNIATALMLGKVVFLKKNNPLWYLINNLGFQIYDLGTFEKCNLKKIIQEHKIKLVSKHVLIEKFSDKKRLVDLIQMFKMVEIMKSN